MRLMKRREAEAGTKRPLLAGGLVKHYTALAREKRGNAALLEQLAKSLAKSGDKPGARYFFGFAENARNSSMGALADARAGRPYANILEKWIRGGIRGKIRPKKPATPKVAR